MKTLITTLLLLFGISTMGMAQKASGNQIEKQFAKKKQPKKQVSHFEKRKKDPNMKHRGTIMEKKRKYDVNSRSFKVKYYKSPTTIKAKKALNKNFRTHYMRIG